MSGSPSELSSPSTWKLAPRDVHLWWLDLHADDASMDEWVRLLSEEEIRLSTRYRFSHVRTRFIVCRAKRKMILSRYLQCAPHEVQFRVGPFGKPSLDRHTELQFNVSHCEDRALLALALGRDIGVDLERVRSNPDSDSIATRYFAPEEAGYYRRSHPAQKAQHFFRLWCLKEAYIKAVGTGLSMPLDSFAILPDEDAQSASLIRTAASAQIEWKFLLFSTVAEFAAALAVKSHPAESIDVVQFAA